MRPATSAAFGTEARIEDFGDDAGWPVDAARARCTAFPRAPHAGARQRPGGRRRSSGASPIPTTNCAPNTRCSAMLLRGILEQVGGEHATAPPARFDDAGWVGWRLAELLPLVDAATAVAAAGRRPARAAGRAARRCCPRAASKSARSARAHAQHRHFSGCWRGLAQFETVQRIAHRGMRGAVVDFGLPQCERR